MLKLANVIIQWYGIQETGTQGENLVVGKLAIVCLCIYLCEIYCVIDVSALEFQKVGKMTKYTCDLRIISEGSALVRVECSCGNVCFLTFSVLISF
jgi:hypothetical protein